MVKRDVIISVLACGGKMSCHKQASLFKEPPVVLGINSGTGPTEGATVQGFKKTALSLKTKGSILQGLFEKHLDFSPRRVCIISYLGGWGFVHEILKTSDAQYIDCILCLEGPSTRSAKPWISFPHRLWIAARQGSVPKSLDMRADSQDQIPSYLLSPTLDKSISIYSKTESPKTKIYHKDTLVKVRNSFLFEYIGNSAQDSIYIQQYVQPRFWQWLQEIWSDEKRGIFYKGINER